VDRHFNDYHATHLSLVKACKTKGSVNWIRVWISSYKCHTTTWVHLWYKLLNSGPFWSTQFFLIVLKMEIILFFLVFYLTLCSYVQGDSLGSLIAFNIRDAPANSSTTESSSNTESTSTQSTNTETTTSTTTSPPEVQTPLSGDGCLVSYYLHYWVSDYANDKFSNVGRLFEGIVCKPFRKNWRY